MIWLEPAFIVTCIIWFALLFTRINEAGLDRPTLHWDIVLLAVAVVVLLLARELMKGGGVIYDWVTIVIPLGFNYKLTACVGVGKHIVLRQQLDDAPS